MFLMRFRSQPPVVSCCFRWFRQVATETRPESEVRYGRPREAAFQEGLERYIGHGRRGGLVKGAFFLVVSFTLQLFNCSVVQLNCCSIVLLFN